MAKTKLNPKKGSLLVEIDGVVRNVIMNRKQMQTIIEMLYIMNDGKIQVTQQAFPTIKLVDLPIKMPKPVEAK